MATNILMPALSPTMTEGTLARWLKREGESVLAGDVIAEIETDKATMEVEAVDEGVLGRILVADGTVNVAVNAPIAVLVQQGERVPDADAPEARSSEPAKPKPQSADSSAKGATPSHAPVEPAAAAMPLGRIFASPLARRLAKDRGIDLTALKGSGPNGRIVRADVEHARHTPAPAAPTPPPLAKAPPAPSQPAAFAASSHQAVPNTSMRRVIARRLTESKQFVPHFYVSIDVELDALLTLRTQLNAQSTADGAGAFRLSVNDLLIKAAAVTLRRVPRVNASYTDEAVLLYEDADISMAVAIPDGLITPIIRQADRKSVVAISNEAKDLVARARAGKLKPAEFQGGTFSISNMGMYGVTSFSAILNPPQGGILAIAAGVPRAIVRDGQLAVATVMTATLSADHRVIDGALAAEWVAAFKAVVEQPLSLML